MEILNNIWNMLTTENENLAIAITSPLCFIEIWLSFLLFTSILKLKYSKEQKVTYIIVATTFSLVITWFIPRPFNTFINCLVVYIVIKFLLKTDIIKTILCVLMPSIIIALISTLINKPLLLIFHLTYSQLASIPLFRFIYLIIVYFIIFILIQFIKLMSLNFTTLTNINPKNKRTIFINLFLGIFSICVQGFITEFYTDVLPLRITISSFVSLLAYFFISFYSLTRTMQLQIKSSELETAKNYNNTLSILYDDVKAFKHDFNNMVYIVGGYISNNDLEGLKTYYKDLEKDCQRVNAIEILNPKIINNSGVYNLLATKYKKAQELKVDFNLEFFFDFDKLNMPVYDFTRILGILLDNALEAASVSTKKQINIIFRFSNLNHTQIIRIENTYNNKEIDVEKIFKKGFSEKENHMGMGLWEVKQILGRNNNVNLITTKDDDLFKQQLEIYF